MYRFCHEEVAAFLDSSGLLGVGVDGRVRLDGTVSVHHVASGVVRALPQDAPLFGVDTHGNGTLGNPAGIK